MATAWNAPQWINVYTNPEVPTQFTGIPHDSRAKARKAGKQELRAEPHTRLIAIIRI
jgi:hypothetical protein